MRAGARGGARVGKPRWRKILMITAGSSMAAGAAALGTGGEVDGEDACE